MVYTGDKSSFTGNTLAGKATQILFSYNYFNFSISVGEPDANGGRVIGGSIGAGISQSATKAGFNVRKIKTKIIE
ncbi:MAG: hypothetical protein E6772_03250 [Dysgonomonas sp.]|nr:hypothetical protein [Dysgonomonas sp.]